MVQSRLRRLSAPLRGEGGIALAFLLPSAAGFCLFFALPFAVGFYYSLVDHPVRGDFVGFANYREVLASASFRKAAGNSLWFTLVSVPAVMSLSLALALLLNRNLPFRDWLRTAYVMPLVVPVASVVLFWQVLFDGFGAVNGWLLSIGAVPRDWMKTEAARWVLVCMYIWKNVGYNMVMFLAGLQMIPKDYYEAASMDGAGRLRQFVSITLVYLTPSSFFVLIMSIINSFKVFRETYLVAGEYPHDSIYLLQHYMNNMFLSLNYQKLTSAAYLMALAIAVAVVALFRVESQFRKALE
ncbi:sugar ABC transporter permease [Paenibacillus sp.]|uniref:carbohydrate ABC transporter permease n=1 Tax=Paenibacillus sp. TaxID=58172 RepID=UPI002D6217A9|nr:sugar ABC transporter permease [Paenibacillus sp.]HZG87745.1 sugar ABC transporter permease [Paenibacillus sp.]